MVPSIDPSKLAVPAVVPEISVNTAATLKSWVAGKMADTRYFAAVLVTVSEVALYVEDNITVGGMFTLWASDCSAKATTKAIIMNTFFIVCFF
jgi:hypothetical protein